MLAEERGQRVEIETEAGASARADARWITVALLNLLHNAIRYAPMGSRIVVRARRRDSDALLEVRDDGPGIAPADQERIFERFVRLDPARHGEGAGLGLSIARWAVEANGGRIEVESARGQGSTFRIVLPRAEP